MFSNFFIIRIIIINPTLLNHKYLQIPASLKVKKMLLLFIIYDSVPESLVDRLLAG